MEEGPGWLQALSCGPGRPLSGCSVSLNTRTTLQYIDYSILLVTELICQDLRLYESDDSLGNHRNDGNDGDYDDDDVDDDGSCDDDDGDAGDGDDDDGAKDDLCRLNRLCGGAVDVAAHRRDPACVRLTGRVSLKSIMVKYHCVRLTGEVSLKSIMVKYHCVRLTDEVSL